MKTIQTNAVPFSSLKEAHGVIPYNMTNDYMFRAVLQTNNKVLCGLIRSLLHLSKDIPLKAEITNPIILGESIDDKEFRLDIHVIINHKILLNLEMQVTNKLNWPNRSLSYLCRSFNQLNKGEDYNNIKPVIHIGFLDYTLFDDYPEFYAIYRLLNIKNHHEYSSNFDLRVVDLTQIELATEEDKQFQIDYWASLFKSTTWEDLKMLAEKNEYLNEASNTIFRLSADEEIRNRCQDREDYYSDIRSYKKENARLNAVIAEMGTVLTEKDTALAEMGTVLAEKDTALAEKDTELAEKDTALAEMAERIKELESRLFNQ